MVPEESSEPAPCEAAREWLAQVEGLPRHSPESAESRLWTGPERLDAVDLEIWRGVDVAFRQPAVAASFDRDRYPSTASLAARGLLRQPIDPRAMDLDVRSIVGLKTLRFFGDDARLVQDIPGGAAAPQLTDRRDEPDIVKLLDAREEAQRAMSLPDWHTAPDDCVVVEIRDEAGSFVGEITMCERSRGWFVALPPTTMAELRSDDGRDGSAGDRSPVLPRPPSGSLSEARNIPPSD